MPTSLSDSGEVLVFYRRGFRGFPSRVAFWVIVAAETARRVIKTTGENTHVQNALSRPPQTPDGGGLVDVSLLGETVRGEVLQLRGRDIKDRSCFFAATVAYYAKEHFHRT